MENASKALIIAGAILLAILIIGLGVFIYNQASGSMKNVNLNKQEIAAFNQTFEQYVGKNVSGSNARALCDEVRTHNNSYKNDASKQVKVQTQKATQTKANTSAIAASSIETIKDGIAAGKTYTINVSYDDNTGLVVCVGIVANP